MPQLRKPFATSGGGFRDSLADMSEELCPSSAATPVPLPFFVRTANQVSSQEFLLLCVCKPPRYQAEIETGQKRD